MNKRIISLLLISVISLISACSSNNKSTKKAAIIDNNGNSVELTANELFKSYDENEARFDELYSGANITFIGTVKNLKKDCNVYTGEGTVTADKSKIVFEEGWCLIIDDENYFEIDLENIEKGEILSVSTEIIGAPFDTDFIKDISDNERVVWLGGKDIEVSEGNQKEDGNNSNTKISINEMIAKAEDLDMKTFAQDYSKNVNIAYDKYNGNYYKVKMLITEIREKDVWFTYATPNGGFSSMYVSFDEDILKKLHSGEYYTVCGRMIVDKKHTTSNKLVDAIILELK